MALAIDASTPAIAVQTNNATTTVTTASFTPPANSLLYIRWSWNTVTGGTPSTPTIADNLGGGALSYTLIDHVSRADSPACNGQAAHWWAVSNGSAMTITVTAVNSGLQGGAVSVTVLTGQHPTTPIGAHGKAASTSAASIAQNYTAQGTNSLGFIGVSDWDTLGAETAGTGCTLTNGGSGSAGSEISYGFIRRTTADGVAGNNNTLNVTIPGTSANLHWVYAEILESPAGGSTPLVVPDWFIVFLAGVQQNYIYNSAAAPDQNLAANAIDTSEAFGSPTVSATYTINANGIQSSENLGAVSTSATSTISAVGVQTSEAFGAPLVSMTVNPAGIPTAELLGGPSITVITAINASGVSSSEQLGAPTLNATYTINANSIASSETVGNNQLFLAQTINASGITSTERFGQPSLNLTIQANGIPSAEILGQSSSTLFVSASGVYTGEGLGSSTIILAQSINAAGIVSQSALGSASLTPGSVTVTASGVVSGEFVGSPNTTSVYTVSASGVSSAEKLGSPSFSVITAINAAGILSETTLGAPSLQSTVTIQAQGIVSAQALGSQTVAQLLLPLGIVTAEALGRAVVSPGAVSVQAHSIASSEIFGLAQITSVPLVPPDPNTIIVFQVGQTTMQVLSGQTGVTIGESQTTLEISA